MGIIGQGDLNYFSADKQRFSFTINQHKLNFNISEQGDIWLMLICCERKILFVG
jgi:hypothetical protein